ncbi:YL1 nuclear protein-domain-containing protein [Lipomyces doorenjongii]
MSVVSDRSRSRSPAHSDLERQDSDVSESPEPVELLVTGREKRTTAGNRLRGLLDIEETLAEEDDVNGIFVETDDDEDFASSEEEEEEEEEEEVEGEEDQEKEEEGKRGEYEVVMEAALAGGGDAGEMGKAYRDQPERSTIKKRKQPETAKDDDMFSDSAHSSDEGPGSADDESDVGEKELMRQEQLEKKLKRTRQAQRMGAFITKGKPTRKIGPKSLKDEQSDKNRQKRAKVSAFQAPDVVRSSTRAHTVKNKKFVLQRLQEQEKRKASNPVHHQPKAKEVLTQEERIQRAKLIEGHNVASLNQFFEQEVIRKKTQRAAMFAQRLILLGPFIRWRSVQVNQPVGQKRLVVEEIEQSEKADGRKRYWRRHIGENDEQKPEKRKYVKKAKLDSSTGATSSAIPGSNENAIVRPVGVTTETLHDISAEPPPTQTFPILPAVETNVRDVITPDVDDDRANGENSQQIDIRDFGPVEPMSPLMKAPELSPLMASSATEGNNKSHDGALSEAKSRDVDGQDDHANEPHAIWKVEDGCDSGAPTTVNTKDGDLDELEKTRLTEDVSATKSAISDDKSNSDATEPQTAYTALDGALPTEETKPESTLSPVELVPCSTELVSLMDFPSDQKLDVATVRSVLLGPQASSGRAPARAKRHLCPITGKAVRFRDPVTGVCYSSLESFKVIRRVLSGAMPWNSAFGDGMYYGKDDGAPEWLVRQVEETEVPFSAATTDR